MLIVCTQDEHIVDWTKDINSDSQDWGAVYCLKPGQNQAEATNQLIEFLSLLAADEPLCLSAHGNDMEIGDAHSGGWGWKDKEIAEILSNTCPKNQGPILTRVCSDSVAAFSAHLAYQLGLFQALKGVWIYGYNKHVEIIERYPTPSTLDKKVDLQGTMVS